MLGLDFTWFGAAGGRVALAVFLLASPACRKDEPLPMPQSAPAPSPAPAPAPAPPAADAGTAPAQVPAAPDPNASNAAPKLPVEFNKPRNRDVKVSSVLVAVDVVGAGSEATAPSNPASWFAELCKKFDSCVLETVQTPGVAVATVGSGLPGDQLGQALEKAWIKGTKNDRERKPQTTNVPAWTAAWLTNAAAAPVAVIWSDGMADATGANAVVNPDRDDEIGGAWALVGRMKRAKPKGKSEPTALLVYVLAKLGHVEEGARVARELFDHGKTWVTGSRYPVEFAETGPLELYPGEPWAVTASLKESAASLKSVRGGERRYVVVDGHAADVAGRPFALPATISVQRSAGAKNRPFLVGIAEEWKSSAKTDLGIGGWELALQVDTRLPAAWPRNAVQINPRLRELPAVQAKPKLLSWQFADTNSATDFRRSLSLVAACASVDGGNHFRFGALDVLPCPPNAARGTDIVGLGCGETQAGQLASLVFGHPNVKAVIETRLNEATTPCAISAQLGKEDKIWGFAALSEPFVSVALATIHVSEPTLQGGQIPQDAQLSGLRDLVTTKQAQSDSLLWQAMSGWLKQPEGYPIAETFAQEDLNLSNTGGAPIKVNKLYAWRLLQDFTQRLAVKSLNEWRKAVTARNGPDPEFELLRLVVESPHAK